MDEFCSWMQQNAKSFTPNTIIDPAQLRSETAQARLHGFAVDRGEIEAGLICIGAPVYDGNHRAVAAVSISGPDYRMRSDWDHMVQEVRTAAKSISSLLGYSVV